MYAEIEKIKQQQQQTVVSSGTSMESFFGEGETFCGQRKYLKTVATTSGAFQAN